MRDFYKRFKFLFNQPGDRTEVVLEKKTSISEFKSWTKISLWVINTFRWIRTSFLKSEIKQDGIQNIRDHCM